MKRVKLVGDEQLSNNPGTDAVSPGLLRARVMEWWREMEWLGLVDSMEDNRLAESLVVEQDKRDSNRVNIILPGKFAGLLDSTRPFPTFATESSKRYAARLARYLREGGEIPLP